MAEGITPESRVLTTQDCDDIRSLTYEISRILVNRMPAVNDPAYPDGPTCYIPKANVPELAETVTLIVADLIQGWLDAGSERDVTIEELTDPIEDHLKGWAV